MIRIRLEVFCLFFMLVAVLLVVLASEARAVGARGLGFALLVASLYLVVSVTLVYLYRDQIRLIK